MMKGIKAEDRVAASLRRTGGHVKQSPGSRGSADIISTWDSGKKWFAQVKSSNTKTPAGLSSTPKTKQPPPLLAKEAITLAYSDIFAKLKLALNSK